MWSYTPPNLIFFVRNHKTILLPTHGSRVGVLFHSRMSGVLHHRAPFNRREESSPVTSVSVPYLSPGLDSSALGFEDFPCHTVFQDEFPVTVTGIGSPWITRGFPLKSYIGPPCHLS